MTKSVDKTRRQMLFAVPGLGLAMIFGPPAQAASLDSYRSRGIIAERYDGFLELRSSGAPDEAKRIVERVNAKRREIYEKRASSQGVATEAVARVYAKQIWEDAPAGTYWKQPNGSYIQK